MAKKKEKIPFEEALSKLEQLVERLEDTNVPLDEAVDCFAEAIEMSNVCSQKLNEAEQKITLLLSNSDGNREVEFEMKGTEDNGDSDK